MSAPARRDNAAPHGSTHGSTAPVSPALEAGFQSKRAHRLWQEAVTIRQEWLDHGLSAQPADRQAAEHSLTFIYAKISRPRPRFTWVSSPAQALPLVAGWPTLGQLYAGIRDPHPRWKPPLASDLAMTESRLRANLSAGVTHADPALTPARKGKRGGPWPQLPPRTALDAGVPLNVVLYQGIRRALHRSLAQGFRVPVRDTLSGGDPSRLPACWYGQAEASWIAYYDALRRLGLAHYQPGDLDHLGHWAALARSCGWWWPGEDVCVIVDRPEFARTEPVAGTWYDEVRLRPGGIRYRDGWHPLLA